MTTIAASLTGGAWKPVSTIPYNVGGVHDPSAGYVIAAVADMFAYPTTSPVVNLFNGSLVLSAGKFGAHHGSWPGTGSQVVSPSVVRTHDFSGGSASWRANWAIIEQTAGVYNWGELDNFVNTHYAAGRQIIHTLFGTPTVYSARPSEASAYYLGTAAEPSDLTKWDAYCAACATRYAGKITHYEIWNEPDSTSFWSGTQTLLAQMTRRANQAIKAIDPAAKIISPAVSSVSGSAATYFLNVLSASDGAGGALKDWVDIIGCHLYSSNYSLRSNIYDQITTARAHMTTAGVAAKQLWNTEFTVLTPQMSTMAIDKQIAAVRGLMLASLAHPSGGVDVSVIYGVDSAVYGLSQLAADAFDDLAGKTITVLNELPDGSLCAVVDGNNYYC